MTKKPLYLCIDQGGHASRAIVYDHAGTEICRHFVEIETITRGNLQVEHDPEALIDSIREAIARISKILGSDRYDIVSAGLATQRSSIVCWDRHNGNALSPVLSWQDRRASERLSELDVLRGEIRKRTGLFPNAHYGATKMRWCLENLSSVGNAAREGRLNVGPLASFVLYHLLDERPFLCDPANASRTMLVNKDSLTWDPWLLSVFDVPAELLPQLRSTISTFGNLRIDDHVIPLHVCTGDQSSALFANQMPDPEMIYINAGTGVFLQKLDRPGVEVDTDLLHSIALDTGKQRIYVAEGTVNGGGRALTWLSEQFGESNIDAKLPQWLNDEHCRGVFINGISGVGSPYWNSNINSYFVDADTQPQKAAAVLESIVFLTMANMQRMGSFSSIVLSGGLSHLDGFCQRLASLGNVPVWRVKNAEATAKGLLRILNGTWDLAQQLEIEKTYFPQDDRPLYARYQRWSVEMARVCA